MTAGRRRGRIKPKREHRSKRKPGGTWQLCQTLCLRNCCLLGGHQSCERDSIKRPPSECRDAEDPKPEAVTFVDHSPGTQLVYAKERADDIGFLSATGQRNSVGREYRQCCFTWRAPARVTRVASSRRNEKTKERAYSSPLRGPLRADVRAMHYLWYRVPVGAAGSHRVRSSFRAYDVRGNTGRSQRRLRSSHRRRRRVE